MKYNMVKNREAMRPSGWTAQRASLASVSLCAACRLIKDEKMMECATDTTYHSTLG
jgi:hypothetical protein